MCSCSRSAGISRGWRSFDLLERHAAPLVHEVDEPEVARAEDDRPPGRTRRSSASASACPVASPTALPDHRVLLVAAARRSSTCAGLERALDEVVEAVAVALLERRALRLAVVGEDDDLVRTRRVAAGALDAVELLVELAQRLHRVGALEPGVVRDLVVARERRVHGRAAAHHVGQHAVDDQVAHDHAHRRRAATGRSRRGARAAGRRGASRGRSRPLQDDLPAEQHERARDVEAVGEERAVARVRLLLRLDPADREDDLLGLAREQVPPARAAVREQADTARVPPLELRAIGRCRARHEHARSPSRPSGRPACCRSSRAGSPPDSLLSATTGRFPIRPADASAP